MREYFFFDIFLTANDLVKATCIYHVSCMYICIRLAYAICDSLNWGHDVSFIHGPLKMVVCKIYDAD
jgi:hypothetical protein